VKPCINTLFFATFFLMITFCGRREANKRNGVSTAVSETPTSTAPSPKPAVFAIKGEDIPLRSGPGEQSPKIINEKATSVTRETQYCTVDYTTKVEILATKGDWSKVRVVDPEWLQNTHIGWIHTKYIVDPAAILPPSTAKLSSADYEILATRHNPSVENFHVLFKPKKFNKEDLYVFTQLFRKEHCTRRCNVSLYDSKAIKELIDVYPLPQKDYLLMADHLLSISTFDAPELRDWYPYQDVHYKELGGKHFKKEPKE
jgi:hypothetical protein